MFRPILTTLRETIFSFLTLCSTYHFSPDRSNRSSPSFSSTFQNFPNLFPIYFPKCQNFSTMQSCAPNVAVYYFLSFQFSNVMNLFHDERCFCHGNPGLNFILEGPAEHIDGALRRPWKLQFSTREKKPLRKLSATKPRAPQNVRQPCPGQKEFKEYRF